MPLVKSGMVVEDRYVRVLDDAPMPDGVPVLVPAQRFLADARRARRSAARRSALLWPNDRRVAELAAVARSAVADRAGVPEIPRRPRLQPGALVARAIRLSRRVARDRRCAARPVPVPAARRLRRVRGEEAGGCASVRRKPPRAYSVFYQPSADGRLPALRRRLQPRGCLQHGARTRPVAAR